jgi:hypothetical protein
MSVLLCSDKVRPLQLPQLFPVTNHIDAWGQACVCCLFWTCDHVCWKNERMKERKNERTKERKNERTKERKNERTKERENERTREERHKHTLSLCLSRIHLLSEFIQFPISTPLIHRWVFRYEEWVTINNSLSLSLCPEFIYWVNSFSSLFLPHSSTGECFGMKSE